MDKTAHYRRVVWVSEKPDTLAKVVAKCFKKVPEKTIPSFTTHDGRDCIVARRRIGREPYFLHFVIYEGGASAAVIAALTGADALDASVAAPPDGHEFIQSQLFCIVQGGHVVWTSHNTPLRERSINALFHALIERQLGQGDDTQFEFQAKLDKTAFRNAFHDGIAEIDLGVGDFRPVLEELNSNGKIPGMGALRSLVQRDLKPEEIEAASNVSSTLILKPGRRWDKPGVRDLLSDVAENVFEGHEDEFVIRTKKGVTLTRQKMSVHSSYAVSGDKQVLSPIDVENNLTKILGEWGSSGLLE